MTADHWQTMENAEFVYTVVGVAPKSFLGVSETQGAVCALPGSPKTYARFGGFCPSLPPAPAEERT